MKDYYLTDNNNILKLSGLVLPKISANKKNYLEQIQKFYNN